MVAFRVIGIAEEVELNIHALEDLVEMNVVLGHQLFGRGPLSLGIYHDGSSMGVCAADEQDVFVHLSHASDEDVRRYVGSKMA
jgi:hypothetical protein